MSGRLMGEVFAMQKHSDANSRLSDAELVVALALADHGNDDGSSIYPSLDHVAQKVGKSKRQVRRIVHKLETQGLLQVVVEGRHHRPTEYRMNTSREVIAMTSQEPAREDTQMSPLREDTVMTPQAKNREDISDPQGGHSYDPQGGHSYDPLTVKNHPLNRQLATPQRDGRAHAHAHASPRAHASAHTHEAPNPEATAATHITNFQEWWRTHPEIPDRLTAWQQYDTEQGNHDEQPF